MAEDLDEPCDECKESPPWLTTWADMMSVLLTFFIVLQAFSTLSEKKFYEAMSSIQAAFRMPLPIRAPGNARYDEPRTADEIETTLSEEELKGVSVEDFGDRIVVTVDSQMLFGLGEARLTSGGTQVMDTVTRALSVASGPIRVEGHTCNLPVGRGSVYRNNWELSAARALTVLEELTLRGVEPQRLAAVGLGEYHPLAPNDSEENRMRNRRVEFIIEKRP